MTALQLKLMLTQALRTIDPESDVVKKFRAAFAFRQDEENGNLFETEEGAPGLLCALEIAFNSYPDQPGSIPDLPAIPMERDFVKDLAYAAYNVDDFVYEGLFNRLERAGSLPTSEQQAHDIVISALEAYARHAKENRSP